MKAKIYPLEKLNSEVKLFPSTFASHLAIICASLAVGESVLKNVASSVDIDITIAWCKQIGASIIKKDDILYIKGFDSDSKDLKSKRIINIKSSVFECGDHSITAKLMLPLLATFKQPVGIKASKKVIKELHLFQDKLAANSVDYIEFENLIRIENKLSRFQEELQGKEDAYMAAGLMLAFPFVRGKNSICLHAPVINYDDYIAISKLLKKFNIEVKHPASMVFEIEGYQTYKSCTYTIENNPLNICYIGLLLNNFKKTKKAKIKILNANKEFTFDNHKALDLFNKHLFSFNNNYIKSKGMLNDRFDASITNNLVPFLYVYSSINSTPTNLYNIKSSNPNIIEMVHLMNKIFSKLEIEYSEENGNVTINPGKVLLKKQVETNKNPFVVMAISYLALLSSSPLIIKDAQAVYEINNDFFEQIKALGGKVELIHN